MSSIVDVVAREILDSRGNPDRRGRRAARVRRDGPRRRALGRLDRQREAIELRDGDKSRYGGKGVLKAVEHVNTEISRSDRRPRRRASRRFIDKTLIELDGTENKSRLGANALLAVSLATAKAAAEESRPAAVPLLRRLGRDAACRCR